MASAAPISPACTTKAIRTLPAAGAAVGAAEERVDTAQL